MPNEREVSHDSYGPDSYGEAFADVYDEWYQDVSDIDASTRAITELCQGRPVLELGIGTGRLALPIAASGVRVEGVDASPSMLRRLSERLNSHPGGSNVGLHLCDMASELPAGPFGVVFVAYNTFFNLTTEAAQRSCLGMVAERLEPDGFFAVEAFIPAAGGPATDRGVAVRHLDAGVVLNVTIRDGQHVRGQQVQLDPGGVTLRPWQIRYLSPDQLDAMAGDCGLTRVARWADWAGEPITPDADRHVSLYTRTR